jgi:hypothetical protein
MSSRSGRMPSRERPRLGSIASATNEVRSRTKLARRLRCSVGRTGEAWVCVVGQTYAPRAVLLTLAAGGVVAEYATQRLASQGGATSEEGPPAGEERAADPPQSPPDRAGSRRFWGAHLGDCARGHSLCSRSSTACRSRASKELWRARCSRRGLAAPSRGAVRDSASVLSTAQRRPAQGFSSSRLCNRGRRRRRSARLCRGFHRTQRTGSRR